MSFHKSCFEQKPTKIDTAYANMKIKRNDWYKEDHGKLISFTTFVDIDEKSNQEVVFLASKKAYEKDWRKVTLDFRDIIAETFQKHRLARQRRERKEH